MNILAIGPHPDDIEIGCGGTLLKYVQAGHDVNLLVVTTGAIGGDPEVRKEEQTQSAKIMGAKNLIWGELQDTELAENKQLIGKIEEAIRQTNPDIVFIPYLDDIHQDHRAVSYSGITATRYVKEVLFYEVPTSQNFSPDLFVDIGNVLRDKLNLLKTHTSQVTKTRVENLTILESAQSCATFRGFQGRVKHAEGFKALRILRDII